MSGIAFVGHDVVWTGQGRGLVRVSNGKLTAFSTTLGRVRAVVADASLDGGAWFLEQDPLQSDMSMRVEGSERPSLMLGRTVVAGHLVLRCLLRVARTPHALDSLRTNRMALGETAAFRLTLVHRGISRFLVSVRSWWLFPKRNDIAMALWRQRMMLLALTVMRGNLWRHSSWTSDVAMAPWNYREEHEMQRFGQGLTLFWSFDRANGRTFAENEIWAAWLQASSYLVDLEEMLA